MIMTVDNPGDLKAAQALMDALWALNSTEPENVAGTDGVYASDNTFAVLRNPELSMSPYAHVRAALLFSLTRLCDGSRDRAERLLGALTDNGESVAYNLAWVRKEWEAQDAERDPVEDALNALFEKTEYRAELYESLEELVLAAGLRWECAECDARNSARKDVCEHCTEPRPTNIN